MIDREDYNKVCQRLSKLEGIQNHEHIWQPSKDQPGFSVLGLAVDNFIDKKCKICGVDIRVKIEKTHWWDKWL